MLIGISFWHKHKNYHKNEDYLIANRSLSSFATGMTLIASFMGGGSLLGLTAMIFRFGPKAGIYLLGAFFSILLLSMFAGTINKEARKYKWLTLYDFFYHRHGATVKYLIAIIQMISTILITSIALIGGAKLINILTGYSDITSVLMMASVIGVYLVISGFGAVVKTDIIQAFFIFLLFILLYVFARNSINMETLRINANYEPTGIIYYISMFFLGLTLILGEETTIQRVYAAKSGDTAKKSLRLLSLLYIFCYGSITFLSIVLSKIFPDLTGDSAFITSVVRITPYYAMWIIAIGIFSILLSTIDTFVFSGALNINKIFLDKGETCDHIKLKRRIQWTVPILLLAMVLIALFCKSIVNTTLIYSELLAMTSMVFATSFFFKKLNKWYAIFPLVLNLIAIVATLLTIGGGIHFVIIPFVIFPIGCLMAFIFNFICRKVNAVNG